MTVNGAATINNTIDVHPGVVAAGVGFNSLTGSGTGNLYLDNTGNTAFTPGTTIDATGAGQVVGVAVGGVDSLGSATLNLNGGNFSLGSDGTNTQTFANPITTQGSGGTITATQLGAGTITGQTITLSGGISLNGNLNLATSNYNINISGSGLSGGSTVTYGSGGNTISLNGSTPGAFTGTYNANSGDTSVNTTGALNSATTNINNGATVDYHATETLGTTNVNNGTLNVWNPANIANVVVGAGQSAADHRSRRICQWSHHSDPGQRQHLGQQSKRRPDFADGQWQHDRVEQRQQHGLRHDQPDLLGWQHQPGQ